MINDRFKTKANLFNKFFAEQCTLLKNDSVIPTSQRFLARSRLHPFKFSLDEIPKIIRSPDVNKAHGHDNISVAMTKKLRQFIGKTIVTSIWKKFWQVLLSSIMEKVIY